MAKGSKHGKRRVLRPAPDVVIVVAHGLSEVAIAESLGSALRMRIIVVAETSGRSSIQVEGLAQRMHKEPLFKSLAAMKAETGLQKLEQLHVFTVMDVDDIVHADVRQAYLNGSIVGLGKVCYKNRVKAIYCDRNLEDVLKATAMPYARSDSEKTALYLKVFPIAHSAEQRRTKQEDFREFRERLVPLANTNLDELLTTCLQIAAQTDQRL